MSIAEVTNLVIEQNTDFSVSFNLFNDDSSGASLIGISTATGVIRKHKDSIIYENFSINITQSSPALIKLSLTREQTARLELGRNLFDVLIYTSTGGPRNKFIRGTAIVNPSMTPL